VIPFLYLNFEKSKCFWHRIWRPPLPDCGSLLWTVSYNRYKDPTLRVLSQSTFKPE